MHYIRRQIKRKLNCYNNPQDFFQYLIDFPTASHQWIPWLAGVIFPRDCQTTVGVCIHGHTPVHSRRRTSLTTRRWQINVHPVPPLETLHPTLEINGKHQAWRRATTRGTRPRRQAGVGVCDVECHCQWHRSCGQTKRLFLWSISYVDINSGSRDVAHAHRVWADSVLPSFQREMVYNKSSRTCPNSMSTV